MPWRSPFVVGETAQTQPYAGTLRFQINENIDVTKLGALGAKDIPPALAENLLIPLLRLSRIVRYAIKRRVLSHGWNTVHQAAM
jgi:hypothetical protein